MSEPKSQLQLLEIPISDLAQVHHLPAHVRERWASWEGYLTNNDSKQSRIAAVEQRRVDFQHWVSEKGKVRRGSIDNDKERLLVLKKLEGKLAAAQLNREKELEAVRSRAASSTAPRIEVVANRLEQRAEEVAQKLQSNLEAAERRRQARMDADKERLSAAHELVLARLAHSVEQEKRCSSEKRRRMSSRLRKAEETRREQLAAVAGKAGEKVERARQVSRLARVTAERDARSRRVQLLHRLDAAAERRMRARVSSSGSEEADGGSQLADTEHRRLQELAASLRVRQLQSTWRTFVRKRRTTAALASTLAAIGVTAVDSSGKRVEPAAVEEEAEPEVQEVPGGVVWIGGLGGKSPRHAEFESFAERLQSPATLRAAQALLRRLEVRLHAQGVADASCTALLKHLYPKAARTGQLERYPPRVFLCAYMILQHPEVVFNSLGERESQLSSAAQDMVAAFEQLLERILAPPPTAIGSATATPLASPRTEAMPMGVCPSPLRAGIQAYRDAMAKGAEAEAGPRARIGELLVSFDEAWLAYVDQFVAWKSHDAESLVGELVRMAGQLELSLRRKIGGGGWGEGAQERIQRNSDLQAMVVQVEHDLLLLRERVMKLAGQAGVERLEAAVMAARDQAISESDSDWETDRSNPPSRRQSFSGSNLSTQSSPSRPAAPIATASAQSSPARPAAPIAAARSFSAPSELPAQEAPAPTRTSGNEQMVWELLFNPGHRLPTDEAEGTWQRAMARQPIPTSSPAPEPLDFPPANAEELTPEELTNLLKRHAVTIAERAFWDSVTEALGRALREGDLAAVLGPMVVELGGELAGAMGEAKGAEELRGRFSEGLVMQQLRNGGPGGGNSLLRSMELLQQLSQALIELGSEAREADAKAAQQQVGAALQAAAAASGPDAVAQVVAGLVAALRLMFAQLKLLKLDLANARLMMVSQALQSQGAAAYLQSKFANAFELPSAAEMSMANVTPLLPRTAAWLSQVTASQALMEQRLQSMGLSVEVLDAAGRATAGISSSALPEMRSGLRSPARVSASGSASSASSATPLRPQYPAQLRDWRGAQRWAIVSLAAQESAAVNELPEVLEGQGERIHAAQNRLQQLLVATAGLLISQQMRQRAGRAPWTDAERKHAKARVLAVLEDPNMRLDVLVALLSQLAGAATTEEEVQIRGAFRALVSSGSSAYRAISGALTAVLLVRVLLGPELLAGSEDVSRAVAATLGRTGASLMADELGQLGEDLALLATAGEAVHGPVYQALLRA